MNFKKSLLSATLSVFLVIAGLVAFASPAQAALTYFYAGGRQSYVTTGVAANFGIGAPAVTSGDFHSLFELAVQSADGMQTVEAGWTIDHATFGDDDPHFFVGKWVNGTFGGYADTSWVDYASNSLDRGANLSSYVGGAEKAINVQYNGNWWIAFDGAWVGYFPGSAWTSPTFVQSGLIQMFGEVAANVSAPCTNMGNAIYPNGLTYPAAGAPLRISNATYAQGSGVVSLTLFRTNSAYYQTAFQPATSVRSVAIGGGGNNC